jgi:hypothetical protein
LAIDFALADERPIRLEKAPGLDKVEAHCNACHSLDYIVMNSPFLTAAGWDAEVAKMVNAFGAAIDQADAQIIIEYLKANYGADREVSPPTPASERQQPSSRMMAKPARSDHRNAQQKWSKAWKAASGRGAGRVNSRWASVVTRPPRPGLFKWWETRLTASPAGWTNSYECWQDEGYGRRTPCGAGASGGDSGGGGGGGVLPPLLLLAAEDELLLDGAVRVRDATIRAGTDPRLLVGKGMQHDWLLALPWLDESKHAWEVM